MLLYTTLDHLFIAFMREFLSGSLEANSMFSLKKKEKARKEKMSSAETPDFGPLAHLK